MATKTVDSVVADLEKVLRVFKDKTGFTVGEITTTSLQGTITGLRGKSSELEDAKALVTGLVNEVSAMIADGLQVQTRGLSGIRAAFGPDSSEYELAGGTRSSERKKPAPKKKT